MGQLAAVACLSLAAKMEGIAVPLLLYLQVEGTKHVFEEKSVQRMELLVLSALKWKMNHVTPCPFLDHFIRRFGLNKEQLIDVLKISKGKLEECYNFISEVSKDKRKYEEDPAPSSPHGIIGMSLNCENSNYSWLASSIESSHSEHPSKRRRRTQQQHMRLPLPFNRSDFP